MGDGGWGIGDGGWGMGDCWFAAMMCIFGTNGALHTSLGHRPRIWASFALSPEGAGPFHRDGWDAPSGLGVFCDAAPRALP